MGYQYASTVLVPPLSQSRSAREAQRDPLLLSLPLPLLVPLLLLASLERHCECQKAGREGGEEEGRRRRRSECFSRGDVQCAGGERTGCTSSFRSAALLRAARISLRCSPLLFSSFLLHTFPDIEPRNHPRKSFFYYYYLFSYLCFFTFTFKLYARTRDLYVGFPQDKEEGKRKNVSLPPHHPPLNKQARVSGGARHLSMFTDHSYFTLTVARTTGVLARRD